MNLTEEETPCIQDRFWALFGTEEDKVFNLSFILILIIVCLFRYVPQFKQYWGSFYPAVMATFLGIFLGITADRRIVMRQRKRDENQKRNRVKESLLLEINTHKELLQQGESPIRGVGPFMAELPTFSFDGIIASGLYIRLPPELQKIVSNHYQFCNLNNYYVQAGILTDEQDLQKLQDIKIYIRENIDVVLEKLKELSSRA